MQQLSRQAKSKPRGEGLVPSPAVCLMVALLLALSLGSYRLDAETNLVAEGGQLVAGSLVSLMGPGSWLVVWALGKYALRQFQQRARELNIWHLVPSIAACLFWCGSLHVTQQLFPSLRPFGHSLAGGHLGAWVGGGLLMVFGTIGATITCSFVLVCVLLRAARVDSAVAIDRVMGLARSHCHQLVHAWRRSGELLEECEPAALEEELSRATAPRPAVRTVRQRTSEKVVDPIRLLRSGAAKTASPAAERLEPVTAYADVVDESANASLTDEDRELPPSSAPSSPAVSSEHTRSTRGVVTLPRVRLLAAPPAKRATDRTALDQTAQRLVQKLSALGIEGTIEHIKPGRVVTMFQFAPPPSIKVAQIRELGDDLSLALEADDVRVVAPLPGTKRIGIEVPNPHRTDVYLRELLDDERWTNHPGALPLALGVDTAGLPVYADLALMPHLLVAGATGAGKSVGLNAMLLSLLFRYGPADVRMLLVDPKAVELAPFNGIPHLLQPVVTDMSQATRLLDWVVEEMDRRYELLVKAGVRNLRSYNAQIDKRRHAKPDPRASEEEELPCEKLPYIVLVIDEVADLMMVAGKSFPQLLMRLAQKSRASGIHAIIATQRPSVKVINGDIKANLPARIAYKVAQQEDSKTILGRAGAERLLGRGDMLCNLPNEKALKRVHGPFVSDEDVQAVCGYLRAQGASLHEQDESAGAAAPQAQVSVPKLSPEDAALYDRAVELVAVSGRCSATMLQNGLGLGWTKASKVVSWLEADGVVGPAARGSNAAREVFVRPR